MRLTRFVFPVFLLLLPFSSHAGICAATAVIAAAPISSPQTQKRDPLTETESDQIRELSQEPDKRIKLMLKYTQARLATIEQLEGDARMAAGRGKQVHDLLEDFTTLIDELDDNIDEYADKKSDIRKALKEVVETNTSFQLKLRTLKEQKAASKEFADYNFVLQNATEAVNSSLDNARQALQDLEVALKEEKKKK
jgi:regulator of replication initiation timing